MPRLVADTNIYVSALVFGGVAEEVLLLARQHLVELFISAPILDETDGVLRRKFAWTPSRARDAMADIRGYATAVYPKEKIAAVVVDEPDNRILECAVEAKAHFVVSGDSHLRTLRQFRDILILSPRAFLDSFASLI
jgi:putative PIN family toxin of toxin-antitoxin system